MAGLAGEFEAVAEAPAAVAIAVREVVVERAAMTQSSRQTLTVQRNHHQVWEVCMLAGAE